MNMFQDCTFVATTSREACVLKRLLRDEQEKVWTYGKKTSREYKAVTRMKLPERMKEAMTTITTERKRVAVTFVIFSNSKCI